MGILQDFFNGEVLPKEHFGTADDVVYKAFVRKSAELEKELTANMSDKDRKAFEEIKHLWKVQNDSELERMFLYAFRMGADFMADLYAE